VNIRLPAINRRSIAGCPFGTDEVPQGRLKIARQFIAGKEVRIIFSVPQGRTKIARQFIAGKEVRIIFPVPKGRLKISCVHLSRPYGT